jgi:hypothetical protein
MATTTTGFHRFSNITARAAYSTTQTVVPGATIYVSLTSSGAGATIYSDPAMSIQIVGSRITADPSGFYEYYMPLSQNVTETISSVAGLLDVISNIVANGPLAASFTTTANPTDTVTLPGFLSGGHVSLTPTNGIAAGMSGSVYVSTKSNGSFIVTHPSTANGTFDVIATAY